MIYVAQPAPGGPVKIGFTRGTDRVSATKRIATLEPGCPWPLRLICTMPGSVNDEMQLHRRFAEHRIHREWFRLEGELALWLRGIAGDRVGTSLPIVESQRVVPLRRVV